MKKLFVILSFLISVTFVTSCSTVVSGTSKTEIINGNSDLVNIRIFQEFINSVDLMKLELKKADRLAELHCNSFGKIARTYDVDNSFFKTKKYKCLNKKQSNPNTKLSDKSTKNWQYILKTSSGDSFYIDFKSIIIEGNMRSYWNLGSYEKPYKNLVYSRKSLIKVNCSNLRFKPVKVMSFKEPMGKGLIEMWSPCKDGGVCDWQDFPRDSAFGTMNEKVCNGPSINETAIKEKKEIKLSVDLTNLTNSVMNGWRSDYKNQMGSLINSSGCSSSVNLTNLTNSVMNGWRSDYKQQMGALLSCSSCSSSVNFNKLTNSVMNGWRSDYKQQMSSLISCIEN